MDKLPGKPLDLNRANDSQRRHLLEQLVDISLELERHPFDKMGSPLKQESRTVGVGRYAQVPLFESPENSLGPYSSLKTAYTAMLHQQMNLLVSGDISTLPVENYLSLCWRLDALPSLLSSLSSTDGPFYLKHYDDKGDHILVDEEYNITGMIDWEFASTEPKEFAFSSPCMLWPVGEFYDGSNELSKDELLFAQIYKEKGRKDLAEIVLNGRKLQRYLFFNGGGMPAELEEFDYLHLGLLNAFGEADDPAKFSKWKLDALERFQNDAPLLGSCEDSVLEKIVAHWISLSSISVQQQCVRE